MTTARMTRCSHCCEAYVYHPSYSGWINFDPEYNDKDYCPSCMEVIKNALATIPVKFRQQWVDTTDYTAEELREEDKRIENEVASSPGHPIFGKLRARRVLMGLVKIETGEMQQSLCVDLPDPVTKRNCSYAVRWWQSEPGSEKVIKQVWWDIENKKIADDQTDPCKR